MRDERTTERYTIDGCLLGSSKRLLGWQSAFEPGFVLTLDECGGKGQVLLGGERWSGIPGLLRRQAMQAPWSGTGIGLRACQV